MIAGYYAAEDMAAAEAGFGPPPGAPRAAERALAGTACSSPASDGGG